ncbi:MAG: trigger factor [Pseudomonadota bacterium]
MQVTETLSEGLKRELKVTIPASELETRLSERLDELKSQVQLKGFRPGKVPASHLRKMYGKSIMSEVIEKAVTEITDKAIGERDEKPAFQPSILLPEDETEVDGVLTGDSDLSYDVKFEILPPFDVGDLQSISLEKETADVEDDDVQGALTRLADSNKPYEAKPEGEAASEGDRVTIDFVGKIDGEAFDGGSATDAPLVIGSGQFIPGFEEQLIGVKNGDEKALNVTFPEDYNAEQLAGKDAVFDVVVKTVEAPKDAVIDDEFAKTLGMDSLDALKEAITGQIKTEYDGASRNKLKRKLLDKLDEMHIFELPPTLVDREFEGIWTEVKADLERAEKTFEDEDTTEEKAEADYRKIAERRVRLGLVLAKAGEAADVQISDEEMQQAIIQRVRQFPGQEQQVYEFYQKNPQALMEIRAPLYEDKVVDYILELATVTPKTVSKDELMKDDEEGDGD